MPFNQSSTVKNWIYLSILILSIILIFNISSKEFYPADYQEWRRDWGGFKHYLYSASPTQFADLSKFTLAYLVNSFLSNEAYRILLWVNAIFLVLPILCLAFIHGWRLALGAGSVYVIALIFSPIPVYYLFSGALEVQSGVVIGTFMSTLAMLTFSGKRDQPKSLLFLLSLSGFVLPAYKDTVVVVITFGFLLLIFLNIFAHSFFAFSQPSKQTMVVLIKFGALPIIFGMILSASYNMAKYGVYLPVVYLIESRETSPDIYKSVEFFIGSIFSPNGGIIIFWFLSSFMMIWGWRLLGLSPRKSVVWLGAICVLLTLFGLAKWWAPFGWDSWGNRLAIPSIFGLLVGMLISLEPIKSKSIATSEWFKKIKPYRFLIICPVALLSLYYLSVPYLSTSFSTAMQASLNPGTNCQSMYRALQNDTHGMGLEFWKSDIYYNCARERMLHFPLPK
jgi:hypothetical protein